MRTQGSGESTLLLQNALEAAPESPDASLLRQLVTRYGRDTTESLENILRELDHDLNSGLELD